ncbi:hypothetical protein Tco_1272686 [Tanacetum coccineum]
MDPNSSLGKIYLGENVVEILSDKIEGSGDWDSPEYQDTANSGGKKETKAIVFHKMDTEEISDRFMAPCFVNGLEAYDREINLGIEENMILNEYAVKLCLEHEVKRGNKIVKKELIVALRGEIYFVKFIINPDEDDVEPGVIFGRSFLRMTKAITDFRAGTIIIYPDIDPFLEDTKEEEKSMDDWDQFLNFNLDDVPLLGGEELPPFVCKMGKSSRNKKRAIENLNLFYQDIGTSSSTGRHMTQEEAAKEALTLRISQKFALLEEVRPVLETMAYHDRYKKVLDEICKDNVELDGMIVKEEEEAIKKVKGEALKEKDDLRAFIFPIRLEGHVNENTLADTGSDINTMPYRIYEQLGSEEMRSRNHVRKFLRALPSKWRSKVMAIEESKDLSKLSLDELVGNLKVYEVVLEKDLEIAKNKKEQYKSLALKARQVLSDEDASSSDSNDEEYAMAIRDFKKFFRRRGKFVRQTYDDKKKFRKVKEDKKEDRRCFKCGDPNHFISDCPKKSFGDQKAFVVGSWSDSGDDSKKEEICLMAHSNEVLPDTLYYSSSSLDNESRQNKYDKLCQISLRIINKNKHLKTKNESLKRNVSELKTKLDILEKDKEISNKCDVCDKLKMEIESLELKLASFENSSSSLRKMVEMKKPSKDKCRLGYTEDIASCSNNKIKKLGSQIFEKPTVEPAVPVPFPTEPASSYEQHRPSDGTAENGKELGLNVLKKNDSVLITKKSILGTPKSNKQPPILKLGQGHGKSRIQMLHKTTHRRPNVLFPKSDYHQVALEYGRNMYKQFQPPMFNHGKSFPSIPIHWSTNEMLKKFGLEDSKPIKTPMSSETKHTRNEDGEPIDDTKYRGMIGSLLYLTASRPDIMFSVCLCARFQEAPKTSHLEAVKRIFRYIKGTSHLGLWYPKGTGLETIVYADSDHAGDYVNRKSTSDVCTFVGCCLTSWFSKKQTALAISTTEAEYVSAGKACQQALWMKQDLVDYDVKLDDVPILCDNKGAIDLSKKSRFTLSYQTYRNSSSFLS